MIEDAGDEPLDRMGPRQEGVTHHVLGSSSRCGQPQQSGRQPSFFTTWRTGPGSD